VQVEVCVLVLEYTWRRCGVEMDCYLLVDFRRGRLEPECVSVVVAAVAVAVVAAVVAAAFQAFLPLVKRGEVGHSAFVGRGGHFVDFSVGCGKVDGLHESISAHAVVENNVGVRAGVETPQVVVSADLGHRGSGPCVVVGRGVPYVGFRGGPFCHGVVVVDCGGAEPQTA